MLAAMLRSGEWEARRTLDEKQTYEEGWSPTLGGSDLLIQLHVRVLLVSENRPLLVDRGYLRFKLRLLQGKI